ncbi:MAG TPA: hypothetical protein VER55_02230 [Ardenticatenaceae bacterium]|nr:hypothetical protein [Ardenticatenaceae bacterium]
MRDVRAFLLGGLLLALAACSSVPGDVRQFISEQYPDATVAGIQVLGISRSRYLAMVDGAWCVDFTAEPSPVIVYSDDKGLHVFEAFHYGDLTCSEWREF